MTSTAIYPIFVGLPRRIIVLSFGASERIKGCESIPNMHACERPPNSIQLRRRHARKIRSSPAQFYPTIGKPSRLLSSCITGITSISFVRVDLCCRASKQLQTWSAAHACYRPYCTLPASHAGRQGKATTCRHQLCAWPRRKVKSFCQQPAATLLCFHMPTVWKTLRPRLPLDIDWTE